MLWRGLARRKDDLFIPCGHRAGSTTYTSYVLSQHRLLESRLHTCVLLEDGCSMQGAVARLGEDTRGHFCI